MSSSVVCTIDDLEKIAQEKLTQNAWEYYSSGADDQQTLNENKNAFQRIRIRPRFLRGIEKINTEIYLFNKKLKTPICVAPTAMHRMAHDVGEIATARAVRSFGTCMAVSTFGTVSFEDIAISVPGPLYIMQFVILIDRQRSRKSIETAEKSGYKAIMLTIDSPIKGQMVPLMKDSFKDFRLENFKGTSFYNGVKVDVKALSSSSTKDTKICASNLSWKDVDWLRSITTLPILLKGILTHDDATEALKHDIQGIVVSNHGGRQLDGVPATIEALPEIVRAVDGKLDVYLDGGIRKGTDIFKAIALGAKVVFIGRPVLWGLAYDGENGVCKALQILQDELERAMFLAGCSSIEDITRDMVTHQSTYYKL